MRYLWKQLLLIISLVAFSTSAFAEGTLQDENELRLVPGILVSIVYQVRDGCLANPNALKVEAELILRRSGIRVEDPSDNLGFLNSSLVITAFGWEEEYKSGEGTGVCVVRLDTDLWRGALVQEGHTALVSAYHVGGLFTTNKARMQEHLQRSVSENVSDLANEILKAQGN